MSYFDRTRLVALLQTMPGYSAQMPLAEVRAWLLDTASVPDSTLVTTRTVMARLSPADAASVLGTIKAAAAANPLVDEALYQLRGDGLDLSHANAQQMIASLFGEETLRAKVLALGARTMTRWASIGGEPMPSDQQIEVAVTLARGQTWIPPEERHG